MFKSPKAPHISALPKIATPKVAPVATSEHIAKQFQAVHPDNTLMGNLTDMYEVQRHTEFVKKAETDVL